MGTSVQVTPLCGVYNENPLSYLVSIDGFNFLVDCGWNDQFDPSFLQPLSKYTLSLSLSLCVSMYTQPVTCYYASFSPPPFCLILFLWKHEGAPTNFILLVPINNYIFYFFPVSVSVIL